MHILHLKTVSWVFVVIQAAREHLDFQLAHSVMAVRRPSLPRVPDSKAGDIIHIVRQANIDNISPYKLPVKSIPLPAIHKSRTIDQMQTSASESTPVCHLSAENRQLTDLADIGSNCSEKYTELPRDTKPNKHCEQWHKQSAIEQAQETTHLRRHSVIEEAQNISHSRRNSVTDEAHKATHLRRKSVVEEAQEIIHLNNTITLSATSARRQTDTNPLIGAGSHSTSNSKKKSWFYPSNHLVHKLPPLQPQHSQIAISEQSQGLSDIPLQPSAPPLELLKMHGRESGL